LPRKSGAKKHYADRLKIFINCTFPLHEAQAAIEYRLKTTNPGKFVLTVV